MDKTAKKHFKSWVVSSAVAILLIYLLGSFVVLNFNFFEWNIWIRFSFVGFSVISSASMAKIAMNNYEIEQHKKNRKERMNDFQERSNTKKSGFRKMLDEQLEKAKQQREETVKKRKSYNGPTR